MHQRRSHFVPFCIAVAFAAYGWLGNGNNNSAFAIPSISATYNQMANEAALRNALFPNQGGQSGQGLSLKSFL